MCSNINFYSFKFDKRIGIIRTIKQLLNDKQKSKKKYEKNKPHYLEIAQQRRTEEGKQKDYRRLGDKCDEDSDDYDESNEIDENNSRRGKEEDVLFDSLTNFKKRKVSSSSSTINNNKSSKVDKENVYLTNVTKGVDQRHHKEEGSWLDTYK